MAQYVLQPVANGSLYLNNGWDYTMGYAFTPSKTGQVTKLGGLFNGTKTVRLYNSSYSIIASASVTSANSWAYTAITPVTVTAGSLYYVVVLVASSGGAYYTGNYSNLTSSDAVVNYAVYQNPSGTFNSSKYTITTQMYGLADVEISFSNPPQVNIGGVWKSSSSQSVKVDGAWKNINGIFVNINGTWKPA